MPLTYEETREYATLKGFNPDDVEVDPFSGEIRPRNRTQPTMSTAKPADKPKTTGALETIARQASLSAIPSAVSLPGSIAAGSAVTTALSPLFAGGPFTGWIPPVAGLVTGFGVGVASSMAASKLQEKALEQFQGGREYLEKSAALREERPYMSVVGDVAGSLPTMKVDGKVLKDAWHALTTEGAQQGPRMLANKLATSQAAQDVLISGGVGGVSSVVEDKLADKEVDIPKALLNTVLQGAVSTPHEYVGRFPGLKNAPYRGQPLAEPSPAVLGVNEVTRTVRTKEAATGDEAARVAKEIESLNSQIGELEKIRIESEAAKHTEVVTQAKIQLKELKARNEELNKILKGEEKTTTDFVASPESMEFTKAKAAQKGVEDTTFNEGGRQTVDSAEGYGSFSNDGTKIRVNTYAGTKGVKTNLPEGLQGVPTTGAHETVHAELYNVINSEISSQSRLGEQLRAAYENDPRFKEAKAKRPDANFDWNEYATIRAAQKFAKNPSNEGRSWSAERKALANVQKGKATADDADTVLLMKWRYDNGLNAPRGAVRANPNSTTPARNSLASNVEKEIKRVEEQPNTEQLDLPMAKEGTALTKWQRENVADFEKPNFGPETRPAQNEFRFSKPEEENNKTFERAEAYAMARRRRNVENVEEGRQTSLDTATGATVDYVRTPEGLFVLSMDTPAESQGKGGATRLLNELRRKGPVILEANASEGEGLSQAQLTEFYTKRGLRNIGGNRFVGEPIVTPSVAAKAPVVAKPVEAKAPIEDATPIVSGQEQRVRTEGELKTSTIEGQRAFVKKHPLLADFDENGKLKFFYEPNEWRLQELADWFGVTKRNINAYAERQGKSVREIDWNTVVNENQYKPINFPRREGVRGKAVRDEDTGRPLMRERPLNEKLDMDATVSGELSNKDTYLPTIEAGVRTALFPTKNSGEMARRGRTRFAATEGQNRWGSSIQTEAYVKRVTDEVYGAMAKEGLNMRGLDDKATFDDKIFKNAARIAERMLRDDVDVLKTRNINESASTDAPRGDGRTLGDTISTSQKLVPAGERASTEGDEDLIKAVADRIAEKKAELSSQTGIVRATEAMSNERIAAAWTKILDEYEFGRVDAADVMEAAVKVSTELKLRGVPDADIKRGVLDRMRDAGIGAEDSVDAQATARYSRPEDVSADMMEAYRKATSSPDYIESERLSDEARELVTHRDGKSWPTDADHAKADVIRAQADALRSKYYDSADFKAYWKLYEEQRNAERSAELNKERSKIASNDSWDVAPPAKIKLSEDSPAEAVRAAQFKAPSHSTDIDSVESILSEGLRSGSALDTTPDRDWAGDGVSLIMPFARKGSKIEHNDYYKSSGVSAVGRIIVDAGAYNTPLYELESIVQGWKDKHPTVKMEIIDEKGRIIPIEKSSSDVRQSRPEADEPVFTTQLEKELRVARPFGLQVGRDGKLTSSEMLAKVKTLPAIEQELLKQSGLSDVLNVRSRIGADELTNWLKENGPKLEVHNYGMEGKVSEAKKEYDKMSGEYDALGNYASRWATAIDRSSIPQDADAMTSKINADVEKGRLTTKEAEALQRYRELKKQTLTEPKDTSPRATSYYNTVSAFDTNQPMPAWTATRSAKNVQRVDVVMPTKYKDPEGIKLNLYKEQYNAKNADKILWSPDNLHENLPNTLGWAMIQYKDGPNGERVAVIAEAQSRWGQEIRNAKGYYAVRETGNGSWEVYDTKTKKGISEDVTKQEAERMKASMEKEDLRNAGVSDHPLLADTNRLILKAAIDQARKEGATHIMISDAETAMITEKLDYKNSEGRIDRLEGFKFNYDSSYFLKDAEGNPLTNKGFTSSDDAIRYAENVLHLKPASKYPKDWKGPRDESDYTVVQGDLPSIAAELTGTKGERVSLGEHKNAMDVDSSTGESYGSNVPRTDLVFTNPDGSPKTDVSGMLYDISVPAARRATGEEFSMAGRRYSRPEGEGFTSTPEFKRWFGDSKVVDAEGKPLVVYHGSPQGGFSTFDTNRRGYTYGQGAYFTPDKSRAQEYQAKGTGRSYYAYKDKVPLEGSALYETYLSIKNPYIVSSDASVMDIGYRLQRDNKPEFNRLAEILKGKNNYSSTDGVGTAEIGNQWLREQGYDGIIKQWRENDPLEIVAFYPTQIKSATGNDGNFNPANPDIRRSRPEGDDVDPIRTSTDQTKQGPLEKLAPQFDQVRKFDSKVADAFERAEKIKSLNEANYLNTPLVDFRKQFGGANERELKRAYDYALEKYRNPESVDETAFSEREKAMANFWNERISQPTRVHQQRLDMFVETREGLRRKAKLSESYAPEMLNDKAIDVFTKSVDSSESTRMKREWAEHVVKMSASADKPVSMEDAMNEINDFVAAIGRNGAHSADFGALTKAAGYGLPEEMRERNLMRVMQRYGRRSSRLLAKVEGLQSDEYVRGKLRLENPETGKRAEPKDGNDILTHQEVRDAMKFIDGDFEINKSPRLLAAVRVVTNSILGPLSGVRDAASIAANSLPYMRVQDLPTLITSLGDMKSAWRKSLEYGARTGAHPLDAIATPLGTDNVVNAANVVSENLRKWSGRDAIEQFNRAWTYSIGKQLANQAVLSGNKAFLKKFGTLADTKGSDGKVKWDTDIMASNFVDRVQGTYGGRGLPAVAVDGMAAPWFALARWSVEKANVTWQDVIKPAYKGENYLPLLTYSLGTWLTGEAIESLNEALQAGKKSQNANWKEIEAADGGIEQEALRLANVMQLGSFLGMTGDMVKVGADIYKGNTPRGYSVPLADFISEGVIGNMTKFSRAVQDGANPIDALQSLMNDLAKSQWQAYRVGNYWANRDEVERTNKFRDLRVYKQTTGQEVPSEVPQANSAFRADEREFKRSTEPLDAAEKLRGVLDRFREEYKNDPAAMAKALRRLKSNSYQTFPSPQRDIADARKYYEYLTKAYGAEEADARVQDYLRQTKLNSLKSAAIPTLSR